MSQRKNILFLANRIPFPPDKGDKVRTFHQLDHLALSHAVYCACFVDSPADVEHVRALRRWCADVIAVPWSKTRGLLRAARAWPSGSPLTTAAYFDRRMLDRLLEWSAEVSFDAAVAFSSSVAPYALAVPAGRRVLDLCDVDSRKWLDYARGSSFGAAAVYRREGRRLAGYERDCLSRFDATLVITERERDLLDPRHLCPTLHVIPNGTSLPPHRPDPPSSIGSVVGFVGVMSYRPNVEGVCWFVEQVWPHVRRELPDAKFLVIGREPARRVRRLARVPGVVVTGEVEHVQTCLAGMRVVVAPLQIARGLQNKVLEAMAMRRPVVATSAVAAGLRVDPGRNILVADDPETFARRITELSRFDGLCDQIGDAGYRCAAMHYSWTDVLHRYERIVLGQPMSDRSEPTADPTPEARHGRSPFAARFRGRPVEALSNPI